LDTGLKCVKNFTDPVSLTVVGIVEENLITVYPAPLIDNLGMEKG